MPKHLLDQVVGVEKNTNAEQPAGLKLRAVREPQVNRLIRVQRRQRIAHHRRSFRNLPAYLEHGVFTAARAEKRKHVDRAMDQPIDVIIDLGLEIFGPAFIDRGMQRA